MAGLSVRHVLIACSSAFTSASSISSAAISSADAGVVRLPSVSMSAPNGSPSCPSRAHILYPHASYIAAWSVLFVWLEDLPRVLIDPSTSSPRTLHLLPICCKIWLPQKGQSKKGCDSIVNPIFECPLHPEDGQPHVGPTCVSDGALRMLAVCVSQSNIPSQAVERPFSTKPSTVSGHGVTTPETANCRVQYWR